MNGYIISKDRWLNMRFKSLERNIEEWQSLQYDTELKWCRCKGG